MVIKIEASEVRDYSQTYDQSADEIREILTRIQAMQDQLESAWEGQAMLKFQQQFDELRPQVDEFATLLDEIGAQMRSVADQMEQFDKDLGNSIGFN